MDKIAVLVVDEQELFRAGVRQELSRYRDFDVVECSPSDEILSLMETRMPDVVLLGCRLTAHSSLAIAESITRYFPNTRVILLSPDPNDEELFEVIKTGAVA